MRLYVLELGALRNGLPVQGYLIQTDDGLNVLVDTGYEENAHLYPEAHRPRVTKQDWIVNRLAEIGLAPRDIHNVICTHLDPDHAGGNDAFLDATLIVQRVQLEVARLGEYPRFELTRARWEHPGLRYRIVDGDTELLPGIVLIESSGHVPGHQAVLVQLPRTGPVLLCGDALPHGGVVDYTPESRSVHPFFEMDEAGTRASTRKLIDLAEREGVELIIHPHDPKQWAQLRKPPEFYS